MKWTPTENEVLRRRARGLIRAARRLISACNARGGSGYLYDEMRRRTSRASDTARKAAARLDEMVRLKGGKE